MRITTPSQRHLQIFQELIEEGYSIQQVSNRWHLRPDRVEEIREQVMKWRTLVAPDWDQNRYRRQEALSGCRLHQGRAGWCYGLMMESFRISRGMQTVAETSADDVHMTTVYNSPGDPKYLMAALRCSREEMQTGLVIAKLPDEYFTRPQDVESVEMTLPEMEQELHELEEHAKWEERDREAAAARLRQLEAISASRLPPDSVLTDMGGEIHNPAPSPAPVKVATPSQDETSDVADVLRRQSRHDRRKKISPVQPGQANEEKRRELAAKLFGAAG